MKRPPLLRLLAAGLLAAGLLLGLASCGAHLAGEPAEAPNPTPSDAETPAMTDDRPPARPDDDANAESTERELEVVDLGAGCFWCIEAVLEQIDGVVSVTSGYMGGHVEDPTYKQICTGRTGHAEIVRVEFDPARIPFEHLLEWFWRLHDPTTLNRQGNDVGTQYRSAIFYHSEEQRVAAEKSRERAAPEFRDPIVTEITPASTFYGAEDYHQDYYRANKQAGYCRMVIAPKLDKLGLEK